jgi:hypothetical protein
MCLYLDLSHMFISESEMSLIQARVNHPLETLDQALKRNVSEILHLENHPQLPFLFVFFSTSTASTQEMSGTHLCCHSNGILPRWQSHLLIHPTAFFTVWRKNQLEGRKGWEQTKLSWLRSDSHYIEVRTFQNNHPIFSYEKEKHILLS